MLDKEEFKVMTSRNRSDYVTLGDTK